MFKKPSAQKKNTLINVGVLGSFGELVQSKTEGSPYYMENVELRAQGTSTKAPKFRFMWDPEFFANSFDPQKLDKGALFVYKKNIASLDGTSLLEGLCGSAEAFEDLQARIAEADTTDPDTIHGILSSFFAELGPQSVIYVLKQERKQDGLKEDGSKRYVAGQYYEVDEILHLTEKNVKSLVKRVEFATKRIDKAVADGKEAPVKVVFKFEPSDFGIDVEIPQAEPAWVE